MYSALALAVITRIGHHTAGTATDVHGLEKAKLHGFRWQIPCRHSSNRSWSCPTSSRSMAGRTRRLTRKLQRDGGPLAASRNSRITSVSTSAPRDGRAARPPPPPRLKTPPKISPKPPLSPCPDARFRRCRRGRSLLASTETRREIRRLLTFRSRRSGPSCGNYRIPCVHRGQIGCHRLRPPA